MYLIFQRDFTTQNQWCAHEESMAMCREQSLDQAFYFLTRDLTFMRDVSKCKIFILNQANTRSYYQTSET